MILRRFEETAVHIHNLLSETVPRRRAGPGRAGPRHAARSVVGGKTRNEHENSEARGGSTTSLTSTGHVFAAMETKVNIQADRLKCTGPHYGRGTGQNASNERVLCFTFTSIVVQTYTLSAFPTLLSYPTRASAAWCVVENGFLNCFSFPSGHEMGMIQLRRKQRKKKEKFYSVIAASTVRELEIVRVLRTNPCLSSPFVRRRPNMRRRRRRRRLLLLRLLGFWWFHSPFDDVFLCMR